MQIDELPAGEQTQNPDLDMNQVVGTHDILMLCFDTLRYDVSKEEEAAGRTPVLNSHGGEWEKRHAPGNFTYPSHFAIFAGFLPSPAEPHSLRSRKWLFFPVQAGTGRIPPAGSYPFTEATFVQSLANVGYETICIAHGRSLFDARFILPQFLQFFKQLRLFSCEKLRAILKLSRVAYRTTPSTATKGANHYADECVFHRQPESRVGKAGRQAARL